MTPPQERRRSAVSTPPAVVPAATCVRQLPDVVLARSAGGDVVHALADGQPLCRTRATSTVLWDGEPPMRMCVLCARALAGRHLGPFWKPTRVELGDVHLHAALELVAAVRRRLADVRSSAIADGSALLIVERLPVYRAAYDVAADAPEPPLHAATILGQLLDRLVPVRRRTEDDATDPLAQRLTERTVASSAERRLDVRAAYAGRRRERQR